MSCSRSGVNKVVTLWLQLRWRSPPQDAVRMVIPNTVIDVECLRQNNRRGEQRQRSGCWRAGSRRLVLSREEKTGDEASQKTTNGQNDCSCLCFHKCAAA